MSQTVAEAPAKVWADAGKIVAVPSRRPRRLRNPRIAKRQLIMSGLVVLAVLIIQSVSNSEPSTTADQPTIPTATPTQTTSQPVTGPTTASTKPAPKPPAAPAASTTTAHRQLDKLRLIDRRPRGLPRYERQAFGRGWRDTDGNGCNQRDDVLLRDAVKGSVRVQRQGRCLHDVIAGTWHDPYTGKTLSFDNLKNLSQAQAIQIDHIVPLAEAWVSGAYAWKPERRIRFANDLDELIAVDGPANASKGPDDPAAWRPRKAFQCSYAKRWIKVKHRWDLGADQPEKNALREMLRLCR